MRHIFLIGLSGSGKSTVGKLLAQKLGASFLDSDTLIEALSGEHIPTIFERHGEAYFRERERDALLHAIYVHDQDAVIATGGGAILLEENRALMTKHGVRIWLQTDPKMALQRLHTQHELALAQGDAPEMRPLLSGANPYAALQALATARHPFYNEAEFVCITDGKTGEQIVQEIVTMLTQSGMLDEEMQPIVRHVHVGNGYDVIVEWGGLQQLPQYLAQRSLPKRVFLFTDSNIARLYGEVVMKNLADNGFEPQLYIVPAGEKSKSPEQLNAMYDWLLEHHAERKEAIIALGGGVIGDLVGYVAATYLRGVPLIQVPTSLLAQVDAAIGGKTGINHPRGKNLIGAFYHPQLVLADPSLLLTMPTRERTEGWAEVVKYGIILDAELFSLLVAHAESLRTFTHPSVHLLCQVIARCIELKVMIIEEDEREQGRRAILNYGHTIAHAIENVAGYGEWLHGEAVSLGMVAAARLAYEAGMFPLEEMTRQNALLTQLGLPTRYSGSLQPTDILHALLLDKKVAGKQVHWIMPRHIGEVVVTKMPDELVQRVVTEFFAQEEA